MIKATYTISLTTITAGLLLGSTVLPGNSAWAANASQDSSQGASNSSQGASQGPSASRGASPQTASPRGQSASVSREREALGDIGRARHAAQNSQATALLNEIGNAETALLNASQIDPDVHADAALQHLTTARQEAMHGDLKDADAELARATRDVTVALADNTGPGAGTAASAMPPMAGDVAYDANADRVGEVVDVIYDADGNPAGVIINVGPDLGQGDKDVSVPANAVSTSADGVTIARSREQVSQAPSSAPPNYRSPSQ